MLNKFSTKRFQLVSFSSLRQLKISEKVYGLLEVFIKSRSIVVDNEDDILFFLILHIAFHLFSIVSLELHGSGK